MIMEMIIGFRWQVLLDSGQ